MMHRCRLRTFQIGVLVCMLLAALPAGAVLSSDALDTPPYGLFLQPGTAQTDGAVTALAQDDRTLYLSGAFSYIGPLTGGLTKLDASNGAVIQGMPMVNGTVQAIAPDGAGGWFIGGSFNRVGSMPRRNLAHIRADYSVDSVWQPDPAWPVYALAVTQGRLYAGGGIKLDGSVGLEAFDAANGIRVPWNPPTLLIWQSTSGVHGSVDQILVAGEAIIVSGSYRVVNSTSVCCESLILDRASGFVQAMPEGLLVGLRPLAASGTMLYLLDGWDIRALNTATGALLPWRVPLVGSVYDAHVLADQVTLYLAGNFTQVCSQQRTGLAAIDGVSGRVLPWAPKLSGNAIRIIMRGSAVIATGTAIETGHPFLATIDRQSAAVVIHPLALNGRVAALDNGDGALIAGGLFNSSGGMIRHGLAALDLTNGQATAWAPEGIDGTVNVLAAESGVVYLGGEFTRASGQQRINLAALNSVTGQLLPWNPSANDEVSTLVLTGTTLYAGGIFTRIGGRAQAYLAAINSATGQVANWSPLLPGPVTALAVSGNTIYVATGAQVIAFDISTGQQLWSTILEQFFAASSLVVSDRIIAVAGQTSLVVLDASTGAERFTVRAWRAAVLLHGVLYASARGEDNTPYWRDDLRAYDAATGREISLLRAAGRILAILEAGDLLVVGGDFWSISGEPRAGIALFRQIALPERVVLPIIRLS